MATLYPVSLTSYYEERDDHRQVLVDDFKADAQAAYDRREAELGEEVMRELERRVLLTVLDRKWREHRRDGLPARGHRPAGRWPSGTLWSSTSARAKGMFNAMMEAFMEESSSRPPPRGRGQPGAAGRGGHRCGWRPDAHGRRSQPQRQRPGGRRQAAGRVRAGRGRPGVALNVLDEDVSEDELEEIVSELPSARTEVRQGPEQATQPGAGVLGPGRGRVGQDGRLVEHHDRQPYAGVTRNAPCPCGSGKKFKMCHGRPGAV